MKKSLQLLFLILLIAGLGGCGLFERKDEISAEQRKPQSIPAVRVISQMLSREDVFPAELLAYQDVAVYPKVPGFIKWIGVDRGSVVKQGQLMVLLEAPE